MVPSTWPFAGSLSRRSRASIPAIPSCPARPRREHSRKTDEFYGLVESLCVGRKLDHFSREPRPGWAQFGNDLDKFGDAA